jgi:hypothetical protein
MAEMKFPAYSEQDLSSFEGQMIAIAASRLGVFGTVAPIEEDLLTRIKAVSPEVPSKIKAVIQAYRDWSEAITQNAPEEALSVCQQQAEAARKSLTESVQIWN